MLRSSLRQRTVNRVCGPNVGPIELARGAQVLDATLAEKSKREGLKAKRDMLFAEYLKSPRNIRLAVEIKLIDDDIAKSVEQMERQRRRK
jgi:hypothetical protein